MVSAARYKAGESGSRPRASRSLLFAVTILLSVAKTGSSDDNPGCFQPVKEECRARAVFRETIHPSIL